MTFLVSTMRPGPAGRADQLGPGGQLSFSWRDLKSLIGRATSTRPACNPGWTASKLAFWTGRIPLRGHRVGVLELDLDPGPSLELLVDLKQHSAVHVAGGVLIHVGRRVVHRGDNLSLRLVGRRNEGDQLRIDRRTTARSSASARHDDGTGVVQLVRGFVPVGGLAPFTENAVRA